MSAALLPPLCLVEDDEIMGESLCDRFRLEGFAVDWYRGAAEARAALAQGGYAAVVSDVRLPGASGEELYEALLREGGRLPPFIFITGFGSIDRAVRLLKLGAADYVTKPFDLDALVEKVRVLVQPWLATHKAEQPESVLGVSPSMRDIAASLPRLARHAATVLITGDSGVGKESVARELHRLAHAGQDAPFVAVNCGALPESLMEAELFGYEKGAFTGALRSKRGVFEQAHGGTLFLDEIGEMPPLMQVKLLRAIQERCITRVGGEELIRVELRLVCATNRNLKRMVEEGSFREDLYYRINVIHLRVPPLRERKEDILWFATLFLNEYAARHPGEHRVLHPVTEEALLHYGWPGNVRELRHAIERACILSGQTVLEPGAFFEGPEAHPAAPSANPSLGEYLMECERNYIRRALASNEGRVTRAAEALGISRKNLWEKMRKLGIPGHGEGVD